MSAEESPKRYLVPGRDGEIREVTEAEMQERDEILRGPYSGIPLEIGRIVRAAGQANPPFTGAEEMFINYSK